MMSSVRKRMGLAVHARLVQTFAVAAIIAGVFSGPASTAPYAAMVMDARSGEVLHSRNADTRLHPASLTKMMTLYIAFEAVENGEIGLNTTVTISKNAASEPPSKLGLRAGQEIRFRYLIRAASLRSANDAATAIAETISGSEADFALRMNRTAVALGMNRTTFKNAHGLTQNGHLSTARDMTILGRRLLYDYPDYYNLFSRPKASVGSGNVSNTNRHFLNSYRGADGIKTGYTRAAGYNLVASARRGRERIIATLFGGTSKTQRTSKITELLEMGFERAQTNVAVSLPDRPAYAPGGNAQIPIMSRAPQPAPRAAFLESRRRIAEIQDGIEETVTAVVNAERAQPPPMPRPEPVAAEGGSGTKTAFPTPRPDRPLAPDPEERDREVVARPSSSGGRDWGINIGSFDSMDEAESALIRTALAEVETLDGVERTVIRNPQGYDANFVGMTKESADLACRRLAARQLGCRMIGPS